MTFLRVSTASTSLRAMDNVKIARDRFEALQQKLVSGKEVERPKDDPVGIQQILNFNTRIKESEQYQKNVDYTKGRLEITSSTLHSIEDILLEIRNTALTFDSTVITSAERAAAATTVETLLEELVQLGNTKYLGKFIFGGTHTLSGTQSLANPFNATTDSNGQITGVTRNPLGIDDLFYRELAKGLEIAANISGSAAFMPNGEGQEGDIFQTIIDLRDALGNNDLDAIRDEISNVEGLIDQVTEQDSLVGSRVNRIENVKSQLEEQNINTKAYKSDIEDVDYSKLLIEMNTAQTVLNATLQTSSQLLQLSLLNFL